MNTEIQLFRNRQTDILKVNPEKATEGDVRAEEDKEKGVVAEVPASTDLVDESTNIHEKPKLNLLDANVDEDDSLELEGIQVATQVEKKTYKTLE